MRKIFTFLLLALFSATTFADTWTVAGSNTTILGSEWTPSDENNDMAQDGTCWYLAKSFENSEGQSLAFKVCKDHGWGTAYPKDNYVITIPAGYTKAHFMFNTNDNNNVACAYLFSVAGSSDALFGAEWTPTTNDMTEKDGVFSWKKEDVELAAGTITLKVAANHAWGHAWPGDNYELVIATSGKYDVTITFDPAKQEVSANAEKKEDVVVVPSIKLHGNFTGSWADTEELEVADNKETASLTLENLAVGTYYFGVKIDGAWTSNGSAFTRGAAAHEISSGTGDLSIVVDKAGNYTFTWTYESNTLSVSYPELVNSAVKVEAPEHVTVTVKAGEEAIGATVEELTVLTITAEAAEGYRVTSLRAFKTGDETTEVAITAGQLTMPGYAITIVAEEATHLENGYYLVGIFNDVPAWGYESLTPAKKFVLNLDNTDFVEYQLENVTLAEDDSLKVVYLVDDVIQWYAPDEKNYLVDANHAGVKTVYFRPNGDGDASWWYNCIYVPSNSTTSLDNTDADSKVQKFFRNGQLIIIKNGVRYNAQGAVVE